MLLAGAYRAQPQRSLQRAWLGSGSGSSPVSCTRRRRSVSAQPNRCAPEASFCRLARCMARRRRSGHTAAWLRTGPCTYPCELSNSLSHHPRARASWQRRSTRRSRPRPALLHYKHAARARQAVSSVDAGREAWWQRHTARRGVERQRRAQLAAPARTREGGSCAQRAKRCATPPRTVQASRHTCFHRPWQPPTAFRARRASGPRSIGDRLASRRDVQHDGSSPGPAVLAVLATGFKPEARRHTGSLRDTSLRSRRRSAPRHCVGGSPFHGAIRPCAGSCSSCDHVGRSLWFALVDERAALFSGATHTEVSPGSFPFQQAALRFARRWRAAFRHPVADGKTASGAPPARLRRRDGSAKCASGA